MCGSVLLTHQDTTHQTYPEYDLVDSALYPQLQQEELPSSDHAPAVEVKEKETTPEQHHKEEKGFLNVGNEGLILTCCQGLLSFFSWSSSQKEEKENPVMILFIN